MRAVERRPAPWPALEVRSQAEWPVVALEATWTRPGGLVVLQSATQATQLIQHATGGCPNPCRGTADTRPFLAGPVFPALTAPRRRHRWSAADFRRFRFRFAQGDVALAV
jgi:hypothetical protein